MTQLTRHCSHSRDTQTNVPWNISKRDFHRRTPNDVIILTNFEWLHHLTNSTNKEMSEICWNLSRRTKRCPRFVSFSKSLPPIRRNCRKDVCRVEIPEVENRSHQGVLVPTEATCTEATCTDDDKQCNFHSVLLRTITQTQSTNAHTIRGSCRDAKSWWIRIGAEHAQLPLDYEMSPHLPFTDPRMIWHLSSNPTPDARSAMARRNRRSRPMHRRHPECFVHVANNSVHSTKRRHATSLKLELEETRRIFKVSQLWETPQLFPCLTPKSTFFPNPHTWRRTHTAKSPRTKDCLSYAKPTPLPHARTTSLTPSQHTMVAQLRPHLSNLTSK